MEEDEASELSDYFCDKMNNTSNASFKLTKHGKNVRVIIKGPEDFVVDTIKGWYK